MSNILVGVQSGDWYDENDHFASMKRLRECGFDAIDFNIDHVLAPIKYAKGEGEYPIAKLPTDEFVEFFRALKEAKEINGIHISQMHAPFPFYIPEKDEANEFFREVNVKCMAVCALVGCPAIVIHPYVDPDGNKEREFFINFTTYRKLIPAAKEYNVKICLENIPRWKGHLIMNGCCTDPDEACYYIDSLNEEAGEEIFGFCFDVGHANITGRDIKQDLKILDKRVTILHIHGNDRENDLHLIPYTTIKANKHTLDWDGFIEGLREIGYDGTLSFETFNALRMIPESVHTDALKFISSIGRYFKAKIEE